MRTIWLGAVLAWVAACDSGAPSCKDAIAKAAAKSGPAASGDEQAALTKVCEDKKWSGDVRGCLSRATSKTDAASCLRPVMGDLLDLGANTKGKLEELEAKAKAAAQQANDQAKAAMNSLIAAQQALKANMEEVDLAVNDLASATNDAAREKAKLALEAVRANKAELEAKIAQYKADAAKAARETGVHISKECQDNPLAAGC
jgi:hypothetical protein